MNFLRSTRITKNPTKKNPQCLLIVMPKIVSCICMLLISAPGLAFACSLGENGLARPIMDCPPGQHYSGGPDCGCVPGEAPTPNVALTLEGKNMIFEAPADEVLKEAGIPDANTCSIDSECAAAPDLCGVYVPVASKHVHELIAYFTRKRQKSPCSTRVDPRAGETIACVDKRCVLAIPKQSGQK